MSQKLRNWMATPAEAKTAWLVAAGCVVLIITAFIRPLLPGDDGQKSDDAVQQPRHAITDESRLDENSLNENRQSASIEKIIEKEQQESEPAAVEEAGPAAPATPVPVVKAAPKAAVKKPEPTASTTAITESTDTASVAAILANAEMKRTNGVLPKGYYVQLGAFSKPNGAETLRKKLAPKVGNTHLKKKANGMTAVWAGPYATRKEADKAKTEIARRTNVKGYTVAN